MTTPADLTTPTDLVVRIQWHAPDFQFAAGLVRDGKPWILDGALVGMGYTPGQAVTELVGAARHLVIHGQNYLHPEPLPLADREWLFSLLDTDPDPGDPMYAAIAVARRARGPRASVTYTDEPNSGGTSHL